jgi:alanine dehydrogenase
VHVPGFGRTRGPYYPDSTRASHACYRSPAWGENGMKVGIPSEIKPLEGRVGLVPAACAELVRHGHEVFVQSGAGHNSGYRDGDFEAAGARVLPDAASVYEAAELIVKVKEPVDGDLAHLRAGHRLFCYLHLAANPALGERLREIGLTAVAFETVRVGGALPLLAPMSDIAGRLAIQVGTYLLHQPHGGKGLLLGGLAAAHRGHVVVLGAGVAGGAAVQTAAALGARVTVFDISRERMMAMRALGENVTALYAYQQAIGETLPSADILVGAVLLPGRRTPHLVTREMIRKMTPGSVAIDISVDQGGCLETTRPTSYEDPVYVEEGISHFCVTNMPGAVPRSASQALSASLIPHVLRLATPDWAEDPALMEGVNVQDGAYVNPAVKAELEGRED